MKILCSVSIPTYHRPVDLVNSINSIVSMSDEPGRVEIIVRATNSDVETLAAMAKLLPTNENIKLVVGPRMNGYSSLCEYHDECFRYSRGDWFWQFNDDVVVLTHGWDSHLASHEQSDVDVILTPELHRLGGSGYHNDRSCPFFFQHRSHWPLLYSPHFGACSDGMSFSYANKHGHKYKFLPIGVHHLRPPESEISRVRAL